MSDWYRDFANSGFGTTITKQLGLPRPAVLRRYEPGQPLLPGPAVVGRFKCCRTCKTALRDPLAISVALLNPLGLRIILPATGRVLLVFRSLP